MRTYTVASGSDSLVAKFRKRLDYENSTGDYSDEYLTDETLIGFCDQVWPEVYRLMVLSSEAYDVFEHTFQTSGSVVSYPLPDDWYKSLGVNMSTDSSENNLSRIRKVNWSERNSFQSPNSSDALSTDRHGRVRSDSGYIFMGSSIRVYPPPAANRLVRLNYVPLPVQISGSDQTLSFHGGWEELFLQHLTRKVKQLEDEPLGEIEKEIARLEKSLLPDMRERDLAENDRLADPDRE